MLKAARNGGVNRGIDAPPVHGSRPVARHRGKSELDGVGDAGGAVDERPPRASTRGGGGGSRGGGLAQAEMDRNP